MGRTRDATEERIFLKLAVNFLAVCDGQNPDQSVPGVNAVDDPVIPGAKLINIF